jgi:hypothetical protein
MAMNPMASADNPINGAIQNSESCQSKGRLHVMFQLLTSIERCKSFAGIEP